MNGAELMVRAIKRQGVSTVFGLPGHLEEFFGALETHGVRLIHMRHESAVILAADGYARTRRGIGVACVTAGPGFANAIGGLASAYQACTPLLVFTGRNPFMLAEGGWGQELDHTRIARSVTKWSATVYEASRLGEYIDLACRAALSGQPGPVVLEIASDLASAQVDAEVAEESLRPLPPITRPLADPAAIARAADVLMQARNPLVIAGSGAYWGNAGPGLTRLAGEFGLPVMTRALARGLLPEDMNGVFPWPLGYPAARAADVVLLAGCRMGWTIGLGAPPFYRDDAHFIQVDIEAREIGRNRYVEAPVVGDCGAAVNALAAELQARRYQAPSADWVKQAIAEKLAKLDAAGQGQSGQVHPLHVGREFAKRMPRNSIFVGDGANCLSWMKAAIKVHQAPGWMDHDPFGTMGVGLPLAIGAVAAEQETPAPRPVFVSSGDGAFGQYLGELATASLHGLPLLIVVANNGGWGASRNIERRLCNRTYGLDFAQSRYDLVAQGLECHGEFAASPGEVGPALDRALEAVRGGKPAVVNVLVDPATDAQRAADPAYQMFTWNYDFPIQRSLRDRQARASHTQR